MIFSNLLRTYKMVCLICDDFRMIFIFTTNWFLNGKSNLQVLKKRFLGVTTEN